MTLCAEANAKVCSSKQRSSLEQLLLGFSKNVLEVPVCSRQPGTNLMHLVKRFVEKHLNSSDLNLDNG